MSNILIVEDDSRQRKVLKLILLREGYDVQTAEDGESALQKLKESFFDVVITDIRMPGMTGKKLLEEINAIDPELPVIIVTAYGEIGDAVKMVVHKGAFYYLEKPINNEQLKSEIRRALKSKVEDEMDKVRKSEKIGDKYEFKELIGKGKKMTDVYRKMEKIIKRDAKQVLITGETGTGKDLVAKCIHKYGHRSKKRLIPVSCSTITESLFESQLFGHEKGAFTGADSKKIGLFGAADGGIVLLDEIGDVPLSIQIKLLGVIEERQFFPIGGVESIPIDVCIIATTNVDIEKAVEKGDFRQDLYYRLNVVSLSLPPLRERREDIPLLVEHFLSLFIKEYKNVRSKKITCRAMSALRQYEWPGNVRQLENCLRQVFVLSESDKISIKDLPADISKTSTSPVELQIDIPESGISLEEVIKQYTLAALRQTKGNQTQAAKLLGITRRALQYRVDKVYKIDIEEFK